MTLSRAPRAVSLRVRLRARLIRLALLLSLVALAGGSLGACNSAGTGELVPGTGPLVTVQSRGGMCPEGMCDTTVVLERDGRVHDGKTPPTNHGRVNADAYAALEAAIRATDFAAMKAKPFTGECPIAFDGQEQIFEFFVGTTTQRLASCEVEIDWSSPLFIAVAGALGEWIAIPLF